MTKRGRALRETNVGPGLLTAAGKQYPFEIEGIWRSEEAGLKFCAFDSSYVARLRSGDTHVEGHFVRYFSELIRLKVRSRLNSMEAMEDVRQETFMRVLALLRAEDGLRQPDRLGPFVNSVCNHVLWEHYRAQKRVPRSIDEEDESTIPTSEPNALNLLEAKDTERIVRQVLNELNDRDRRLLQAVLLDERDKDEVCAEFGISREYLRVLLHRAKQSFKTSYTSRTNALPSCAANRGSLHSA